MSGMASRSAVRKESSTFLRGGGSLDPPPLASRCGSRAAVAAGAAELSVAGRRNATSGEHPPCGQPALALPPPCPTPAAGPGTHRWQDERLHTYRYVCNVPFISNIATDKYLLWRVSRVITRSGPILRSTSPVDRDRSHPAQMVFVFSHYASLIGQTACPVSGCGPMLAPLSTSSAHKLLCSEGYFADMPEGRHGGGAMSMSQRGGATTANARMHGATGWAR